MRAFDIISTTPFRRLADKQQVFGLVGDDHSRTRYSHSIETAEIAKQLLAAISPSRRPGPGAEETLEAGCLLHDIAMPPFGHDGETLIRNWVEQERPRLAEFGAAPYEEYAQFDSNAQGLRLIFYHAQFETLRTAEAAASVAASMKYPWVRGASNARKCGIFASELERFHETAAAAGLRETRDGVFERHPLSWLVEIADDIAYLSADIEDAARLDVIEPSEFGEIFSPFAPPMVAESDPESRGHALWRFRRRLVERLVHRFAEKLERAAPGPGALQAAAEAFFADARIQSLKAHSARLIYARRDQLERASEPTMRRLLGAVFAEMAEQTGGDPAIAEVVRRFREKRASLVARSTPLQLTVDLVSEFTDGYANRLALGDAPPSV